MALALSMSQENNSKLVDVEDEVAKAIIRDITNTADSGNNLNSNYDDDDVEQSDNAKSSQESHSSSKTSVSQNSGSIKLQIEDDDSRSSTSTLKPNPEDEDSRLSSASSSSTIKSSQHSNSSKSDDESDTKKESRTAENKSDNETSRSSFTASSQKSSQQKESQSSQVTSSIAHASENSNSNSSFVKSQATKSSQLSNKDSDDEDSKSTSDVKKSPVKPSQPKKFSSLIDSDSDDDILVTHGSNYNKKQSDSDTCVSKKERLSKLAEKSKQRKRQLLDSDSDTEISTKEKSVKRNKKASGNNSDSNQSSSDNSTSSDDDNDGKQSRLTKNKISNIVDSESDSDNDSRPQFGNNDSTNIDDTDQLLKEKKAKKRTGSARASKDAAMQQIHSETQRLIRESELSLPYHRPKQRTLKEFLNRKKIKASIPQNISCAAKVKMFSHEISKIVDEKEKEAMEFYKSSDSEEEVTNTQPVKEDSSENEKQLDNKQIDEGTCDDDLESNQLVAILTQRLNPDNISEAHNKREILQKRNNDFNVPRKLFLNDVGDNEDNENSLSPENVPNKELSTEEQEIEMDQDLERKVNDDQSKDESSIENNTVLENSTEDIVLNISESEFDTSDVKKLADFSKSCDLTASETVMLAETPCSADKDGNVYQTNALVNMVTQKLNQDYNIQDAPNKRELLQKRGDFKVPKKLLMKDSIDDEEVSKSKLSDTSSKSSETQLENSEEALVLNLSGSELDSSGDKKLGSGSSMEIGSTPNKSKIANLDDDEVSLINEEKTDDGIIDKNALLVENFLPLDFAEDKPKKPSLKEQILAEAMKVKPMLKGCPGMTIDFSSSGKLKEGTEKLLDRFHRHKKLRRRNPEEICEVKVMTTEGSGADLTIVEEILPFKKTIDVDDPSQMEPKPGEKLKKLREDLKRKIAASRCEEWKQKEKRNKEEEEEEMEYSKDKTCNDDYLDDEEILEEEEEESAESEPEENDVPMVDKKRKRCDFGDEEAEESDEGVENYAGVELDNEEDEENDEDEVDEEEEDEEEEEEEEEKEVVHQPKKLKRIIRLDDDDDDDDEDSNSKASVIVSEASNGSNRSEVDGIIPVNRERVGSDARRPNCKTPLPGNSLDTMISPVAHLTALNTSVDSDKKSNSVNKNYFNLGKIEDSPSVDDSFRPPTDSSQKKQNLQKKLFEDPPEAIIDNEVADIISGFTTKTIPSEFTQLNTAVSESQLIDICSGAFSSQADDEKPKCTQLDKICTDDTSQDMILTLDDESCASPIKQTVQEKKEDKKENDKEQEGNSRSYIQKPAVKNPMDAWLQRAKQVQKPETVINDTNNTNYESSKIPPPDKESLGDIEPMNVNNDAQKISEKIVQNSNQTKSKKSDPKKIRKPITEDDGPKSRFMILSSSDEEESNEKKSKKRPKKLLKKKKVQKLELSDDEDEADSDEFSDEEENNDVDEEDEEKYIDYDSDENEVIVVPKKDIKKVARNYVDEEAELSESDWGSADEDENELDEMEVNEADAEDIDEAQVKDQLEKMHMKQVLDEDQREVRLLQELLFEDGDLHSDGKGRERKFKWKNIDKMFDGLSQRPEEDNDEIDDEVDPDLELQMRKIRYEQTKFLEEKEKNMNSVIEEDFSKGQILGKSLKIVNASKMSTTSVNLQDPESAKNNKIFKSVSSSTIKVVSNSKSLSIENWKGSFLSRGDETLTRIAQNLPVKGPLNLKTGRGNFVFKHISPSVASASKEDAENDEEAPNPEPMNRKRKMFASQSSQGQTPRTTKKLKTDERGKAGKKLF